MSSPPSSPSPSAPSAPSAPVPSASGGLGGARRLTPALYVRDAVWSSDDCLLLTDHQASLWRLEVDSGEVSKVEDGARLLALVGAELDVEHLPIRSPAAGTYPLVAVSLEGRRAVVTHDFVVLVECAGSADGAPGASSGWRLVSGQFGGYYPMLRFSPCGRWLAADCQGLHLFDVDSGQRLFWHPEASVGLWASSCELVCSFAEQGATYDRSELGWVRRDRAGRWMLARERRALPPRHLVVAVAAAGAEVLVAEGAALVRRGLDDGPPRWALALAAPVESCELAADGRRALVHLEDGRVAVIDVTHGRVVAELSGPALSARLSPSGRRVLTLGALPTNPYPLPGTSPPPERGVLVYELCDSDER